MKRNQVAAMIIAALLFASTKTAFAQASAALDEYGLRAGHSSPINSLAFSADGNVLHSVASDSSWRTWDAASGKARSGRVLESRGWTGGTIDPAASRVLMRTPLLYAFDLQTGVKVGGVSPIYDRSIVAFAPNPDWSIIVTSERNGDAIIWDLKTGREMIRKRIHSHNLVSGFTFTRGGAAILCNTGLSGIYVWYPFKGEVEQAIPSDFDITPNIVLTVGKNGADGFVALRRGKVEHWDVVTGILNKAPLRVLDEQGKGARIFAVANDASLAAAAYKDGTVKVWRLADGFCLAEFKPSSGSDPDALAFAPGGKSIAIAYGKGELEVWDLSAKRLAWRAERHNPTAPQPVVATGGRRLTASGKKLLLAEGGSAPREIGTHDDFVCAIALSDDGRVAASAAWGGGLALWDTATGKVVWKGATAGREACSLSLSPTGDLIAAGFVDGSCLVLDAAFGKEQASLPAAVDSPVASIALAPAGARAVVLYTNKQAALFNLAGSAILAVTSDTYDVRLPAFSADGRSAALYAWGRLRKDGWLKDSGLMVFSSFDSKPSIKFHKEQPSDEDNAVSTLALSPDGSIVAAGTKSGRGYAFTARYGARFDLKSPLPGPVTGVTFLSGGETRFRTAGAEASIVATIPRHFDAIGSLAFSADGKALFSGGADGDLRSYDSATGTALGRLAVGIYPIAYITASADGKRLDIKEKGYYSHAISSATLDKLYDYYILGPYNFVSADGKTHYVVKENDVDVYTFPEKVHFREFEKPEYQKMVAADMSPGVQWLFIAFADLSLHGWELDKPKKLTDTMFGVPQVAATTILQKLPAAPGFLATAPGGKRVALAMADGAWLMDPKSRKPIAVLSPSGGYVCCFAFSFAGDLLAVADSSGKISLYETAKGKPVRTLAAQSGAVSAIAFSRDGRLFAAAGADRMIKIFEVATGNELTSITDKD